MAHPTDDLELPEDPPEACDPLEDLGDEQPPTVSDPLGQPPSMGVSDTDSDDDTIPTVPPKGASPFVLTQKGVWFCDKSGEKNPEWVWLSPPFGVIARSKDDNDEWGKLLKWRDPDGELVSWVMSSRLLAEPTELWRALYAHGLEIATGAKQRNLLLSFLRDQRPSGRVRVVDRLGWHTDAATGDTVFVMPDTAYGRKGTEVATYRFRGATANNPYQVKGSVEDWRDQIGRLCVGNSRLVVSASVPFASALLHPMGELSGGVHWYGPSSGGKSSAGLAGLSLGCPPDGMDQYRATANGIEAVCSRRCDGVMVLDEFGQVEAREAGEIAYMIANNKGKARMTRDAEARKSKEWRVMYRPPIPRGRARSGRVRAGWSDYRPRAPRAARCSCRIPASSRPARPRPAIGGLPDFGETLVRPRPSIPPRKVIDRSA